MGCRCVCTTDMKTTSATPALETPHGYRRWLAMTSGGGGGSGGSGGGWGGGQFDWIDAMWYLLAARVLAGFACVMGIVVVSGWIYGFAPAVAIIPELPPLKFDSAIVIFLLGASCLLRGLGSKPGLGTSGSWSRVVAWMAGCVLLWNFASGVMGAAFGPGALILSLLTQVADIQQATNISPVTGLILTLLVLSAGLNYERPALRDLGVCLRRFAIGLSAIFSLVFVWWMLFGDAVSGYVILDASDAHKTWLLATVGISQALIDRARRMGIDLAFSVGTASRSKNLISTCAVWGILVIGLGVSCASAYHVHQDARENAHLLFDHFSSRLAGKVQMSLHNALSPIDYLNASTSEGHSRIYREETSHSPTRDDISHLLAHRRGGSDEADNIVHVSFVWAQDMPLLAQGVQENYHPHASRPRPDRSHARPHHLRPTHPRPSRGEGAHRGLDEHHLSALWRAIGESGPVTSPVRRKRTPAGFVEIQTVAWPIYQSSKQQTQRQDSTNLGNQAQDRLLGVAYLDLNVRSFTGFVNGLRGGQLAVRLYASRTPEPQMLLLQSYEDPSTHLTSSDAWSMGEFRRTHEIVAGGNTWLLATSSLQAFDAKIERASTSLFAGFGALLTMLLSSSVWMISRGRSQVASIASQLTQDLTRMAMVAERTSSGVIMTDANRKIIWVNDGFTAITGYSFEEAKGQTPGALLSCDATDPVRKALMREAIHAGLGCRVELINRHKSGAQYVVDVEIQPIRDYKGELTGFISLQNDITQQVKSREELLVLRRQLEVAADAARVGWWEADLSTGKVLWSDIVRQIHEVPPTFHPTIESALTYYPPEHRETVHDLLKIALKERSSFDFTLPLVTDKGNRRWVRSVGRPVTDGSRVVRVTGAFQDVTQQREQSEALRRSEGRYRTLVEGTQVILWEYDTNLDAFTYVSPQASSLGYGLQEWFVPGFIQRIIHRDDRESTAMLREEQVAKGTAFRLQYRVRAKDDRTLWVDDFVAAPEKRGGGYVLRGVLVDITSRVEQEENLKAAIEASRIADRAKSEFIANISHELRTPLTAILGNAEVLGEVLEMDGSQPPAKQADHEPLVSALASSSATQHAQQAATTIKSAGQHLLTIINDILDLSKMEAERMQVERIRTPLVTVLREVANMLCHSAQQKGLGIKLVCDAPIPEVILCDPTRLRQILLNLIGNAVKFTPRGEVIIRVRTTPAFEDGQGPAQVDNRRLFIDVEDTGPGITPEQQLRLFMAFGQADATITRRFGGTGLGLAICKRFANLLGGDVTLSRSIVGSGSTFTLELPCDCEQGEIVMVRDITFDVAQMAPACSAAPSEVVAGAQATLLAAGAGCLNKRILLVEDGIDNQRLIVFMLGKAGAHVQLASDGQEALTRYLDAIKVGATFDLIITDVQMPVMDGYTFANTLRTMGCEIPIVALTAHATQEDQQRSLANGCDAHVVKPINRIELLGTCQRLFGRKSKLARLAA